MAILKVEFVTAYGPKKRVGLSCPSPGRTKQSMAAECDINNIMAKYDKTGLLDFVNEHQPNYGDCVGVDFANALGTVARARDMFAQLPGQVRQDFNNDPEEFFDFVNDPENHDEAVEMGLIVEEPTGQTRKDPEPSKATEKSPGEPKEGSKDA